MKKLLIAMLILLLALGTAACGSNQTEKPPETTQNEKDSVDAASKRQVELIVFAAASMTETLEEIANIYSQTNPDVKITFNFDSSGTLKTQIQEGAECDLFISAGQKQMDQLDVTAPNTVNTDGLDFVQSTSRIDLLENRIALVVPNNNPANINSFGDMATALTNGDILFGMGNSDVPVGQYTQKILEYFSLNEQELANIGYITYGTNVKEVTTQITEASVDCGVIYCTDAFVSGLNIVDYATPDMCGRVIYPAAVLKESKAKDIAEEFLAYLLTDEAIAVFEKVGFSKL